MTAGTTRRTVSYTHLDVYKRQVFSYAPGMEDGETPALTQAEAQVKAETFLSALCGGRWSALTLYDGRDNTEDRRPYYTFTYVQQDVYKRQVVGAQDFLALRVKLRIAEYVFHV